MYDFPEETRNMIWTVVHETPAVDVRVCLNPPFFTPSVSMVDSLLTSPKILEEFFRLRAWSQPGLGIDGMLNGEAYVRSLTVDELADIVWRQMFVEHTPLSETARAVLTSLGLFGFDVGSGDLRLLRERSEELSAGERLEKSLGLANLDHVLYPVESMDFLAPESEPPSHPAFCPVLGLNQLLGDWKESARKLRLLGFGLKAKVDEFAPMELRRHLAGEIARLNPIAVSLDWPCGVRIRDDGVGRLVREALIPLCREHRLAFVMAVGNPDGSEGPAGGVEELSSLWDDNPDVNFLLVPAEEEQLSTAVAAAGRRRNLLLCGPDRPFSGPVGMKGFTACRLERLGASFHYCHSGAATVEELAGCWAHHRWTLGETLLGRYSELWRTGWRFGEAEVRRDVVALLGGNARMFLGM